MSIGLLFTKGYQKLFRKFNFNDFNEVGSMRQRVEVWKSRLKHLPIQVTTAAEWNIRAWTMNQDHIQANQLINPKKPQK